MKKNIIYHFTWLILLLVTLTLTTCEKGNNTLPETEDPAGPKEPDPEESAGESSYVPINWKTTTISSMDLESGNVTLNFQEKVPVFINGESVIVLQTDTSAHIRRVTNALVNRNSVVLQTTQGDMTDLFKDIEFTLSTETMDATVLTKSGVDAQNVFHPVKVMQQTEHGWKTVYDLNNPAATRAETGTSNKATLLNYVSPNLTGKVLPFYEDGLTLGWEKYSYSVGLDAILTFKFGSTYKEGTTIKIGDIENVGFMLKGYTDMDFLLKCVTQGNVSLNSAEQLAKFFSTKLIFTVGGVPVEVGFSGTLNFGLSFGVSGQWSASAGFKASGGIDLGYEYDKQTKEWSPVKSKNFAY